MSRFYLVRHADAYDIENGVQLDDYPLNNYGRIQALQLAKRLKQNKFDGMYCSRIKRSIETCQIVNAEHQMEVIYTSGLNEVGSEDWPQPGHKSNPSFIRDFKEATDRISHTFRKLKKRHIDEEVILFTHGNWIRVLLTKILAKSDADAFCHFVIHNASLTIIDVDETGYEFIISVSDAAHTHLYESHI